MGTRADFYIGRGPKAEWLGSTAWDGYPSGFAGKDGNVKTSPIFSAEGEDTYRVAVMTELAGREDATLPAQGWPWPWGTSHTTDYAYAFDGGRVWASCYGHAWFDPTEDEPEHDDDKPTEFPNMKERANVTFGKRSGVIILGAKS